MDDDQSKPRLFSIVGAMTLVPHQRLHRFSLATKGQIVVQAVSWTFRQEMG